jgi:hypothetical protein
MYDLMPPIPVLAHNWEPTASVVRSNFTCIYITFPPPTSTCLSLSDGSLYGMNFDFPEQILLNVLGRKLSDHSVWIDAINRVTNVKLTTEQQLQMM